jgi:CubicO group peptidase (beta-lactamase class C family)
MHKILRFTLLVATAAMLATGALAGPASGPVAPNEARAKALLEVLPQPRPERLAFVEANFAPELIQSRGVDALTAMTADLHEDLGDAKLVAVRAGGHGDGLALVLRTTNEEWFELRLAFDASGRIANLGLSPTAPLARSGPQGPIAERELGAAAKGFLDERVAKGFSGAVILAKDGVPVFAVAGGEADRATHRANTLDTPINLGSMNKMFTALVIGRLVEQGKLGWQDKVGKHLPAWPQARVRDEVTIAQLLNHTSGLKSYWNEDYDRRRAELDTAAEYAELCADQAPAPQPGERFEYSNCGFALLGLIAERAAKKDYYELVRELVYRPAGMANSDHYDRGDPTSSRAVGYLASGETNSGTLAKLGAPAGGGYASANDLLRFATALRAGKIVTRETLGLMTTKHSTMGPAGYGYGFGVIQSPNWSEGFFGHNGEAPGISADMAMFASGWTVIVLSNVDRGAGTIAQQLHRMVGTRTPG